MAPRFPLMVDLDDRPVLVVGGGAVATRKVLGLLGAGARVTVVSPGLSAPLAELVRAGTVRWHEGRYLALGRAEGDLPFALVIAATDEPAVNDQVAADARRAGLWANHAGLPDGGPVAVPASRTEGRLTVAVSTGGAHPAAGAWAADRAMAAIGPEVVELLDLVDEVRAADAEGGGSGHRPDWKCAVDSGTLELIREGRRAEAKERLQACLSS